MEVRIGTQAAPDSALYHLLWFPSCTNYMREASPNPPVNSDMTISVSHQEVALWSPRISYGSAECSEKVILNQPFFLVRTMATGG